MTWTQIKKLEEERTEAVAAMKAILKLAQDEKRDLTAEESAKFDELNGIAEARKASADDLRKRANAIAALDAPAEPLPVEIRQDKAPKIERTAQPEGPTDEQRAEAFNLWLRQGREGLTPDQRAMLRPSSQQAAELRAIGVGGNVVGTRPFFDRLFEVMKHVAGPIQAGATQINTSHGNEVAMPTIDDTANDAAIVGEGGAISDSDDPTLGDLLLNAYKYASGIVRVSIELLQDNEYDVESVIIRQCGLRIGRGLNAHLTSGTGTGQPTGFLTGITTVSSAGAAVTYEDLVDLETAVDRAYQAARTGPDAASYQLAAATLGDVRKIQDGAGNYVFLAGRAAEPDMINGWPYVVNNDMPAVGTGLNPIAFGKFAEYAVRSVTTPVLQRLDERYAEFGQVGFHVLSRHDGGLGTPDAIKALQMSA